APDTWTDKVAGRISAMLVRGEKPCIANVAQELAISVRHLQNQLQREGMTYRLLLERLRKEAALTYLEDSGVPICDVAFLLGFADQSVFNHAFKRWTGISPGVYRRAMPTAHD
ncbi:MAG: helix-turn-helix transcriptional regulator, partial [Anaerolineae bacterium]|nr:helix-turn-helix transcriptional regulator [Anaerolineae bacterium]